MAGIVFLKTKRLEEVRRFYVERVGMRVWLEQPGIAILQHGNLLVGFHQQDRPDLQGLLTFFYPGREQVDEVYARLEDTASSVPKVNERYRIYHFFGTDPEGRKTEFQAFLHPVEPHEEATGLLAGRRSIRQFTGDDVPDELVDRLVESCRWAPSSRNSQPCYLVVTRDRARIDTLAGVRAGSSAPIGRAPVAVAVVADPEKSGRHVEDGCIMAYHLLLAARAYGLGTCWIGGMDRAEVKDALGIPAGHHIAAVTPLGWPAEAPVPRERKPAGKLRRDA